MKRRRVLHMVGLGLLALWFAPGTKEKLRRPKSIRVDGARVGDRVRIWHTIGPNLEDLPEPREEWATVTMRAQSVSHTRITVVTDSGLDFIWKTRRAA